MASNHGSKMKSDNQPSMIIGCYSRPKKYKLLIEELEKRGMSPREIRFIDVKIDVSDNKKYNDSINFLKEFVNPSYWERNPLFSNNFIVKNLVKHMDNKLNLKQINFNGDSWKPHKKHPLLYSLACPLFIQNTSQFFTEQNEHKNFLSAQLMKSDGYKNDEELETEKENKKIDSEANKLK